MILDDEAKREAFIRFKRERARRFSGTNVTQVKDNEELSSGSQECNESNKEPEEQLPSPDSTQDPILKQILRVLKSEQQETKSELRETKSELQKTKSEVVDLKYSMHMHQVNSEVEKFFGDFHVLMITAEMMKELMKAIREMTANKNEREAATIIVLQDSLFLGQQPSSQLVEFILNIGETRNKFAHDTPDRSYDIQSLVDVLFGVSTNILLRRGIRTDEKVLSSVNKLQGLESCRGEVVTFLEKIDKMADVKSKVTAILSKSENWKSK